MIRIEAQTLKYFSRAAYVDSPIYHEGIRPVRELQWRKLGALLKLAENEPEASRVLDLCCGNGVMLPTLSDMFWSVVGLDLHVTAAERVVECFELKNVTLKSCDVQELHPGLQNSFDCIFAASCLEHFRDIGKISKVLHQILKPGGHLYVLTPSENMLYCIGRKVLGYTKPADHYWTSKEIEAALCEYLNPITLKSYPSALLPIYRMGVYQKHV